MDGDGMGWDGMGVEWGEGKRRSVSQCGEGGEELSEPMVAHAVACPLHLTHPTPLEGTLGALHVHASTRPLRCHPTLGAGLGGEAEGPPTRLLPLGLGCSLTLHPTPTPSSPLGGGGGGGGGGEWVPGTGPRVPSLQTQATKDELEGKTRQNQTPNY